MVDQNPLYEDSRRLRRLKKFSKDARDRIINDPLNDRALLSRSSSNTLKDLQNSPRLRRNLLEDLKAIWSQSDARKDAQIEHGLRKLREVVISVYEEQKTQEEFVKFSFDVYKMSYDYYLWKKEYHQLGNLVLTFIVANMPKHLTAEYEEVYALFISHIECDTGKCLQFLYQRLFAQNRLDSTSRRYLRMSVIFNSRAESPSRWFQLLKEIPKASMAHRFLKDSPAYTEMRDRCLATVSRCYNQISVNFLLEHWYQGFLEESELKRHCQTRINAHGTQIIEFKRTRN